MKNILTLFISLALTAFNSKAQTVNGIPIHNLDTVDTEYMMITVQEKLFSIELIVDIDYGQKNHVTRVGNDRGKNYTFYSRVEILNIMDKLGFELVATELIPASGDIAPISYYIMRRKKSVN